MRQVIYFFIITICLYVSQVTICLAKETAGSTIIKANIKSGSVFRIFGYTSPNSLVQAIGIRTFAQVTSDRDRKSVV